VLLFVYYPFFFGRKDDFTWFQLPCCGFLVFAVSLVFFLAFQSELFES